MEEGGGFLDLGSGGGLPGLILAAKWPTSPALLVEANQRRSAMLRQAVEELEWQERVQVLPARAEDVGRDLSVRSSQGLVVARSFGPPAVVAECAAPLLCLGGLLVVSEPPGSEPEQAEPRWPTGALAELGLQPAAVWEEQFRYQVLRLVSPCPDRYPRRVGVPAKRPLFG